MRSRTIYFLLYTSTIATFGGASTLANAALPPAHPGPTVNDYTAAQSARAEAAARSAGFGNLEITMVQAGNFFLKGEKDGQSYSLTVTPDAKVYSSTPLELTSR